MASQIDWSLGPRQFQSPLSIAAAAAQGQITGYQTGLQNAESQQQLTQQRMATAKDRMDQALATGDRVGYAAALADYQNPNGGLLADINKGLMVAPQLASLYQPTPDQAAQGIPVTKPSGKGQAGVGVGVGPQQYTGGTTIQAPKGSYNMPAPAQVKAGKASYSAPIQEDPNLAGAYQLYAGHTYGAQPVAPQPLASMAQPQGETQSPIPTPGNNLVDNALTMHRYGLINAYRQMIGGLVKDVGADHFDPNNSTIQDALPGFREGYHDITREGGMILPNGQVVWNPIAGQTAATKGQYDLEGKKVEAKGKVAAAGVTATASEHDADQRLAGVQYATDHKGMTLQTNPDGSQTWVAQPAKGGTPPTAAALKVATEFVNKSDPYGGLDPSKAQQRQDQIMTVASEIQSGQLRYYNGTLVDAKTYRPVDTLPGPAPLASVAPAPAAAPAPAPLATSAPPQAPAPRGRMTKEQAKASALTF